MKFGGTSVRTPEARLAACHKVMAVKEAGECPVVVVSAIGRRGEPYATDTLIGLLREIDSTVAPEPRELDMLMGCGEILSAVVFAHTLKTLGCPSLSLRGGQAGIRTDEVFGNARVLGITPVAIVEAVEHGLVPVVCGFQGTFNRGDWPGTEMTTLGRGGSDTTASALGAALRAERVEIYTDVDGVKTADPDFVANAPTLRRVTYDEVAEIAHLGAKVLHPRAAEIAMKFAIPLWVKNTFSEDPGTEIVPRNDLPGRRVTGVTHTGKLVYVSLDLDDVKPPHRQRFQACLYEALARYEVNVHMATLSPDSVAFAVPRESFPLVQDMLDALVLPCDGGSPTVYLVQSTDRPSQAFETQKSLLTAMGEVREVKLSITEGCTMVSVVAYEYLQQAGVYHNILGMLTGEGIPVLQTCDTGYSLSCLIPESELRRAVKVMHLHFGLSAAQ